MATAVYFTVANILILSDMVPAVIASVIAYATGMVVSFIGQSQFTFRVRKHSTGQVVRYLIMSVMGFWVSYASVYLATACFGVRPIWGLPLPQSRFSAQLPGNEVWVFKT